MATEPDAVAPVPAPTLAGPLILSGPAKSDRKGAKDAKAAAKENAGDSFELPFAFAVAWSLCRELESPADLSRIPAEGSDLW